MRIGVVVDDGMFAGGGGCAQYVRNLVPSLAAQSSTDDFVLIHARGAGSRFPVPSPNVSWVEIPATHRLLHRLAWPALGLPAVEHFTGRLDLLHNMLMTTSVATQAPIVSTIHDVFPEIYRHDFKLTGRLFRKSLLRQARHRAAAVITISQASAQDLASIGVPQARIHVTPLALPASDWTFGADRAAVDHGLDGPYLLFVGRMHPRKNLVRLIEAFGIFKERTSAPHLLAIVGNRGWRAEDVDAAMLSSRFSESIRTLGYVPDQEVPGLVRGAAAFVYPSLYEGFGLPLLEAMTCETPIATSKTSAIPEVAGPAAVYFDPRNPADMARSLEAVIFDEELRGRLVGAGRDRLAEFSWERTAELTLGVYAQVLESTKT